MAIHRSTQHLNTLSKEYPGVWQKVGEIACHRPQDDPKWPDWCFIPFGRWVEIVGSTVSRRLIHQWGFITSRLAAIGAWRYTQGIYRFDSEVYEALTRTSIDKEMPSDVFLRLPEWSVHIESPGQKFVGHAVHGFWAHLEADTPHGGPELRFLFDSENGLIPFIFRLGNWSVADSLKREANDTVGKWLLKKLKIPTSLIEMAAEAGAAELQPFLSLVLYLCSEEPEIGDRTQPGPVRPQPKRVKGDSKLFAPSNPKIFQVGSLTGEHLRRARGNRTGENTGKTVRPHIRRAHWHGYWIGPRDGERQFKFNWLPPTVVAGDQKKMKESER
jgi:hypothetical protein